MTYRLNHRHKGSGFVFQGRAGENLGSRQLVYQASDGLWYLADADTIATMPVIGIAMEAIRLGVAGNILLYGYIGSNSWSWTRGSPIYASGTPGELTQTQTPTGTVQAVAMAIKQNMILFDPSLNFDALDFNVNENNWEDLRFPAPIIRLGGASPPTATAYRGGQVLAFADNVDNIIYLITQLPHSWEEGTDIVPHIHWTPEVAGGGGGAENVKWDLTYSWANIDGTFPAETTITVTRDVQNDAINEHLLTNFAAINGIGQTFSSCLIISLKRDTGVANNYGSDAYLVEFDIHYMRNRAGTFNQNP